MVETHLKNARDYRENEVVRICNIKQQIFYTDSGIYPIDLYPSYDFKNDRKVIVMVFEKDKTQEVYQKWRNYDTDNSVKEE